MINRREQDQRQILTTTDILMDKNKSKNVPQTGGTVVNNLCKYDIGIMKTVNHFTPTQCSPRQKILLKK